MYKNINKMKEDLMIADFKEMYNQLLTKNVMSKEKFNEIVQDAIANHEHMSYSITPKNK